jgi:glutamine---fructose-6-phosphate transaminase (isomerizing)
VRGGCHFPISRSLPNYVRYVDVWRLFLTPLLTRIPIGIFGYLNYSTQRSQKEIVDHLLNGLQRLEYRGYDSAGFAVDTSGVNHDPIVVKATGNIEELRKVTEVEKNLKDDISYVHHVGIAHTRWATHGAPCNKNCHPQISGETNDFQVVHNGIITNYRSLKLKLESKGYKFKSDTDTEVIAMLCRYYYEKDPHQSFQNIALSMNTKLEGAFACLIKSPKYPTEMIAMKMGSPMLVGMNMEATPNYCDISYEMAEKGSHFRLKRIGGSRKSLPNTEDFNSRSSTEDRANVDLGSPLALQPDLPKMEFFVASDASAIVEHTKKVVALEDGDMLHCSEYGFSIFRSKDETEGAQLSGSTSRLVDQLEMDIEDIRKGNFPHYMMKEIFEQPVTIRDTMRGRLIKREDGYHVYLGGLRSYQKTIQASRRLLFVACGTSYHAAVATRQILEQLTGIPVMVELASDMLDRQMVILRDDTCFFISQSGETADTLRCLEYAKAQGALCVGITNTVGSAIARATSCGVHLNAGKEIGVASTKAYTSQVVAILLIALLLSEDSLSRQERRQSIMREMDRLPELITEALKTEKPIVTMAESLKDKSDLLLLGRGMQFATCLEGALKIKELAYMHSEGLLAGELKHGPLALVEEGLPVILFMTRDDTFAKLHNALQQVSSRGAKAIIVAEMEEEDPDIKNMASEVFRVPSTIDCLQGIVNIIPMQLLSYHLAVQKGFNVDQPRNLAKSVTVE